MFTGIVEAVGRVVARDRSRLVIESRRRFKGLAAGESMSVDGVCLTIDQISGQRFAFRLLPETLRSSTLSGLREGSGVNLERSLLPGSRLGGHLVLGHVDGQGTILRRFKKGSTLTLEIQAPPQILPFLVPKGPIGIDGISLTLDSQVPSGRSSIHVHLIPYTIRHTTLGKKGIGAKVNLEVDAVAKYLFRIL